MELKFFLLHILKCEHSIRLQAFPPLAMNHAGAKSVRLSSSNAVCACKLLEEIFAQLTSADKRNEGKAKLHIRNQSFFL